MEVYVSYSDIKYVIIMVACTCEMRRISSVLNVPAGDSQILYWLMFQ
jgi:hypothetical protein